MVGVKTKTAGGAETALIELTVAEQHTKLVEIACARVVDHAQESIAAADGKGSVMGNSRAQCCH